MQDAVLEFEAVITGERYYNEDSLWGVYSFLTKNKIPQSQEVSAFETGFDLDITGKYVSSLVGKMQRLAIGGEYIVKAKCVKDNKYGYQYSPVMLQAKIPLEYETQAMFLNSITSKSLTNNLLTAYPNLVNDIINKKIDDIDCSKVKGVGMATWSKIKNKIIDNYLISDIIVLLKPLGVTFVMIKKLLEDEPNPALLKQKIMSNPYILTKIHGLGFKSIDKLAIKLKPELLNSHERLIAFIVYYLTTLGENSGHTWVLKNILIEEINNNVPECAALCNEVLDTKSQILHIQGEKIGLQCYYQIEQEIYQEILDKAHTNTNYLNLNEKKIQKAIKKAEQDQGFSYTAEQLSVINDCLGRSVSFITGKAGCGKTSIMRGIMQAYKEKHCDISACALSAMAAKRIEEATKHTAQTIHRTLGCIGQNKYTFNKYCKLNTDIAVLDEGSMVNASLFLAWLQAIDDRTRIIISGDHKQLPPIGYGNVFSDLIEKLDDSIISKLTKPMRQAQQSGILVDANLIRENLNPIPINEIITPQIVHGDLKDMFYMFRENRQSLFNIACKTYIKVAKEEGTENIVLAVPRKQNCTNCTREINKVIQEAMLPHETREISGFKLGAKIIQTVNDYDKNIFNGEIGYIVDIGIEENDKKPQEYCDVEYPVSAVDKKIIRYYKNELSALDLAYAMTVHKLQGAGYNTVIGIIDMTHYQLLDNCMLYTLLTRAKKRCLLLAEPQAFMKCIKTSHNVRHTWLQVMKEDESSL